MPKLFSALSLLALIVFANPAFAQETEGAGGPPAAVEESAPVDPLPPEEELAQAPAPETQNPPPAEPVSHGNLAEVLDDECDCDIFLDLMDEAGMEKEVLKGDAAHTLFVPTDKAFKALGKDRLNELEKNANRDQLTELLSKHIAAGNISAGQLDNNSTEVMTITLKRLRVIGKDGRLTVNGYKVLESLPADNGMVHVIDGVVEEQAQKATAAPVEEEEKAQEAPEAAAEETENAAETPLAQPAPAPEAKKPWWKVW